jgi:integrase
MSDDIKVSVNAWGNNRSLMLSWVDPVSGKRKTKSAKTKDWRVAERLAGKLAEELEAGLVSPSRITWDEFVIRYQNEKLRTLAPATMESALGSLRQVKRVLEIEFLAKLTAAAMSKFAAELRKEGMGDSTIAHHLRGIKAATRWAAKLGIMAKAPAIEMPKRAKGQSQARSRAITTEEYERMDKAVAKIRPKDTAQWKRFLEGLWLSGLRRSEALTLTWDQDELFCVHLGEKRPVFIIRANGQKSGKAETVPMTPDFAKFLLGTPEAERTGPVFRLIDGRTSQPIDANRVGRIVESIGKAAGVKVGTRTQRNKEKGTATIVPVFAGCHSCRRGFGSKWARRVMPAVLQRLMRHANIATTMTYYVHLDAGAVADELWEKYGCQTDSLQHFSNSPPVESIRR